MLPEKSIQVHLYNIIGTDHGSGDETLIMISGICPICRLRIILFYYYLVSAFNLFIHFICFYELLSLNLFPLLKVRIFNIYLSRNHSEKRQTLSL